MTTITALPTPPTRLDPDNFADRADAFLAALPAFATETNTVAGEVLSARDTAVSSATAATAAANTAAATSGATMWSPLSDYTTGSAAISPTDYQTYIRKAPGGVDTVDPATAPTKWEPVGANKVNRAGDTMLGSLAVLPGQTGANVRRADETVWNVGGAARIPSWATAGRPASPSNGDVGNNTTIGSLEAWNGSAWNPLRISGGVTVALAGTAVDVTGIPSWATWVKLYFFDASTSTTSDVLVQLGTLSGIESTAYKTSAVYSGGASTTSASGYVDGFVFRSIEPVLLCAGDLDIKKVTGNKYSGSGMLGSNGVYLGYCGGGKELAGALERIRILPRSGILDNGTVSVTWGN